jgi:hypothetical protein
MTRRPPRCGVRQRGAAYIAVLGTSLLISVIGVTAILLAQVESRAGQRASDADEARLYARSAVEWGRRHIRETPAWRDGSGTLCAGLAIGAGSFTVQAMDPLDGDLGDYDADPVVLRATGYKGAAVQVDEVTLTPNVKPLRALEVAAVAGMRFDVDGGTVYSSGTLSTNGNFVAFNGATVDADVEASGTVSGGRYLGSRTAAAPRRDPPADNVAMKYYLKHGTTISYTSTGGAIRDVVLSPRNNPYGSATNPEGIYVINVGRNTLTIRDCRIVGTLVILGKSSETRIEGSASLEPAVPNLPTLLTAGSVRMELTDVPLAERPGFNVNPPHAPYDGVSDNDVSDVYPSRIKGLVFIHGNCAQRQTTSLHGALIVGGALSVYGRLGIDHDRGYFTDPPPGFFTDPQPLVSPGTWKRAVR